MATEESQFTAAVDDLAASMKKTVKNMDMTAVIGKQSNLMLNFLNNCGGMKSNEFSVDLEMWDAERQEYFSSSIVLKINEQLTETVNRPNACNVADN